MSITKAAIGTMYHLHEKQYPRNLPLDFTTVGKALNMRVGKEYRDFQLGGLKIKQIRFQTHILTIQSKM